MPIVDTNILHLTKQIKDAHYSMFNDPKLVSDMGKIGDEMQRNVIQQIKAPRRAGSKSHLSQTGRLNAMLRSDDQSEARPPDTRGLSIKAGFGNIDELNRGTKRRFQRATFAMGKGQNPITVPLRSEPDLPSWIIMEFGRKPGIGGASTRGIPKRFQVPYSPRDQEKKFMFGPSLTRHYKKPVFFMAKDKWLDANSERRGHPGIQEQAFFRKGLEKTIPYIEREAWFIIESALERALIAKGWERRYH